MGFSYSAGCPIHFCTIITHANYINNGCYMSKKQYDTDLTDKQWNLIKPLISAEKDGVDYAQSLEIAFSFFVMSYLIDD